MVKIFSKLHESGNILCAPLCPKVSLGICWILVSPSQGCLGSKQVYLTNLCLSREVESVSVLKETISQRNLITSIVNQLNTDRLHSVERVYDEIFVLDSSGDNYLYTYVASPYITAFLK